MIGEKFDQTLPDSAGGSENASAEFFIKSWTVERRRICGRIHASPLGLEYGRRPPRLTKNLNETTGPMRVPRNCGRNVLRTQTTISVSAANGRTLACNTFAPAAASACASS